MRFIYTTLALALSACSPVPESPAQSSAKPVAPSINSPLPTLSKADKIKLGKQIWKNESGGKVSGLTHWNEGEEFPSVGIGHFIWYPENFNGRWVETFPLFLKYAIARDQRNIPTWLLHIEGCPWPNRTAFYQDFNTPHLKSLRDFMSNTVELQTDFIITRSRAALTKILAAAPAKDRARIRSNYAKVASTANGTYALIDYVNFKGDGTSPSESYQGVGWGMLQVLSEMRNTTSGQAAAKEFAESAKRVLLRRVTNSPPARGEKRWTEGWNNRCDTYAKRF